MSNEFAGTLTERVIIEAWDDRRTDAGLSDGQWTRVAECRASIVPDGAGAETEGMAYSALTRLHILIRTRATIAIRQRLRWRGRTFVIRQIIDDVRRADRRELYCEETRA